MSEPPSIDAPPESPAPADAGVGGLLLVADGIGGLDLCARSLARLVPRAGLPLEVRTVRWGHGLGRWLADLTRSTNVDRHAEEASREVADFLGDRLDRPVFLVGKSGGAGVVLRALEALPERSVERAILIAPAVSPGYDLGRALASVRRELVVFTSPLDFALLGAGTWAFGTIDRVRGVSAGLVGFRPPRPDADPAVLQRYGKLHQIRWRPAMARVGYFGGHLAVDLPPFLRRYVVPMLGTGPVDLDAIASGRAARPETDDDGRISGGPPARSPGRPRS